MVTLLAKKDLRLCGSGRAEACAAVSVDLASSSLDGAAQVCTLPLAPPSRQASAAMPCRRGSL